jgi:hypothetical protein
MTAAPSGWLTSSGLDGLETALNDYDWGEVRTQHIAALFTMARAALPAQAALETATDLPLSVAMRMARERTEAGQETWVVAQHKIVEVLVPVPSNGLWYRSRTSWHSEDWHGERWDATGAFTDMQVETAVCRLVDPDEGTRLLRGES